MIEVIMDFDELQNKNVYIYEKDCWETNDVKQKMYLYFSEKLKLPLRSGPDAFREFFWDARFKEYEEFNEEDEWSSYEEYLCFKKENSKYGLKNQNGVRDDMVLIFVNYYKFKEKYEVLANQILDVIESALQESAKYSKDDKSDLLDITIIIES